MTRAVPSSISLKLKGSVPISTTTFPWVMTCSRAPARYSSTSSIPMGWVLVDTQRGVIMMGSFRTKFLMISKLALPVPMITAARSHIVWICPGFWLRISPVSIRLRRCGLAVSLEPSPPRYIIRRTPA
ncbi:MAG: hypothetical protein WBB73_03335 [Candidatus Aminicenantaceae bacterium]